MRGLLSIGLLVAGLSAGRAAYVVSNGPVRPASPWSLAERLAALRIDRALPARTAKAATFQIRGEHAFFKVREAAGPVLLKCPLRGGVAEAFAGYVAEGSAALCQTQAVDEVGDVLLYEVNGRVAPLCPGQYATLSEEQLHHSLFLPALRVPPMPPVPASVLKPGRLELCPKGGANCAVSKAASALLYCGVVETCEGGACFQGAKRDIQPDDVATSLYYYQALAQSKTPSQIAPAACGAVPMSVYLSTLISEAVTATTAARFIEAQPWASASLAVSNGETGDALRAFFARNPRGICMYVRGVDVERPREAEMAAQSFAFPVFAPFDPRATGRATPLLRTLQRAATDDDAMAAVFRRCDLSGDAGCRLKRERIAAQLQSSIGHLAPALGNLAADEIPYHVGASGPFHLVDYDALHVALESSAEIPRPTGRSRLTISYQPVWPESVAEKRAQCLRQPGICLFRAVWNGGQLAASPGKAQLPADDDAFESMVALFARRDANTRCVRKLFDALASATEPRLLELQREIREPLSAGENRSACDPRSRGRTGLVPREDGGASGCPVEDAPRPFGSDPAETCRPVSLVYVQEEPWAAAAARIASIAADKGVTVAVSGIKSTEVRRGALGGWDVLLTVASNYYNRKYPTLVPLLHPAGNQNLSGGQAISDSPGWQLLAGYESSIVYPPPAWLGMPSGGAPPTRADSLRLVEDDVARRGPAPIHPLAFLRAATLSIPASQAEASGQEHYFAQLLAAARQEP